MIVSIALNNPSNYTFTNLDIVSGTINLRVPSPTNVIAVVVKLEGESRTRLVEANSQQTNYNEKKRRPLVELHKLLYKALPVWPPSALQQQDAPWHSKSYTLNAGHYEFPFEFKIPFNNSCSRTNSYATNSQFDLFQMDLAKFPTRHVKQTLPPSLAGFPGEAEIRYYVKVTVNRPEFYKENPRAWQLINFLPIEPPRPASDGEAYARRQHQFCSQFLSATPHKKEGLLSAFRRRSAPEMPGLVEATEKPIPPRFSVDARLPNPAILTCNEGLPLRIIIKQLSERSEPMYLQMLQIELIGHTRVRAGDIMRTETNSWIVASRSNMAVPLGTPADVIGQETCVSEEYWSGKTLPNSVAPSFETCNISRYYELDVRVGLGYGTSTFGKDQLIVLPLRLPVKVFSGIAPPPALLAVMAGNPIPAEPPANSSHLVVPGPHAEPHLGAPLTPVEPPSPSTMQFPPQQGTSIPPHAGIEEYDEAPPSYEDAVAQDMPPVDGPRRDYRPPPPSQDDLGSRKR